MYPDMETPGSVKIRSANASVTSAPCPRDELAAMSKDHGDVLDVSLDPYRFFPLLEYPAWK